MTGRADIEAANPATGEVLEHLDQQPPEALAEALDAVNGRRDELKRWGEALEAELRRRLKLRQARLAVFGEWEVEAASSRESEWDPVELEGAIRRLVDEGVVRAGDVADVITREPVVSRSRAKALASRLVGDAKDAVNAACTWKEKPGKLTVARSVDLLEQAAGSPTAEETPPDGGRADRDGSAPVAPPALAGSPQPPAPTQPQTRRAESSLPAPDPTTLTHEELFAP